MTDNKDMKGVTAHGKAYAISCFRFDGCYRKMVVMLSIAVIFEGET